jgi:hypothetical protein
MTKSIKTIGVKKLDFPRGKCTVALTVKKVEVHWDNLVKALESAAKKTAYTIGYTKNYDKALAENERNKLGKNGDYPGGWVWKTAEEALKFIKDEMLTTASPNWNPADFSVYTLELPNGWDEDVSAEPGEDGVHNLLHDATIVCKWEE